MLFNNKKTARSPANIAFIKYWGQRDQTEILPLNDSFSMNLSDCFTTTTIEFVEDVSVKRCLLKKFKQDSFQPMSADFSDKIDHHITTIKSYLSIKQDYGYTLYSQNSFPLGAGIASSASFFSSLTMAACASIGVRVSKRQLSILSRLSGSGSACRSIPDGFSWWKKGANSENSYAISIAPPEFWPLVDIVIIHSYETKKTTSQQGHRNADTSPYLSARLVDVVQRAKMMKWAFLEKDFTLFGRLIEEEAISLHIIMMSQRPPLFYWSGQTIETIKNVIDLRGQGIEVFFTIDAGENIHVISQEKDKKRVMNYFKHSPGVKELIVNTPSNGAKLINEHLF